MQLRTSPKCPKVSASNFIEFGYDGTSNFTKRWHAKVVEDHQLWRKFGHPPFNLRELPSPMYQAHLALLEGEAIKQEEQRKEMEKNKP